MGFHLLEVPSRGDSRLHFNSSSSSYCGLAYLGFQNLLGEYVIYYHHLDPQLTFYSWLLAHGREEEAVEVISCLEGKSIDNPFVIAQRNEIDFTIRYERENSVRWLDLLKKKDHDTKTLRRLLLGAGTQFMQQFGGINIMSYYLPTVLEKSVGLKESMARLLTACNAISYLIFSGLAVLLVERMGRRGLMILSTFGQFLCFLIITILLRFAETSSNGKAWGSASVAFFFLVSPWHEYGSLKIY
jgi:hypothetical protein